MVCGRRGAFTIDGTPHHCSMTALAAAVACLKNGRSRYDVDHGLVRHRPCAGAALEQHATVVGEIVAEINGDEGTSRDKPA
jgi:hypothetical protein